MSDSFTARQRNAWMLCAMTVPAISFCAGIGWQWALLGGVLSAALFLTQSALQRRQGGLPALAALAFGRRGAKFVLLCAALWNLTALAWFAEKAGSAFPETEDPVAIRLILLTLAAVAAWRGELVPARCAGVIALGLGGVYALLFSTALGEVRLAWLRPWGSWRQATEAVILLWLPSAVWYLQAGGPGRGKCGIWILALLAPAAVAAVTAGCLSPRLAAGQAAPFYEMVKGLSLFRTVERFEPLASAALLSGYFCALSLLLCAARACLGSAQRPWQVVVLAALAGAGSFWAKHIPTGLILAGTSIFWGLLPLLIPLLVDCKKDGKKSKLKLDKSDSV